MTHERDHERDQARKHNVEIDNAIPGRTSSSAALHVSTQPSMSGIIMRKAADANGVMPGAETAVAAAESSSGAALPEPLQRKFESSLGTDLSSVRIHTGGASEHATRSVGARAYAVGQDIHFGSGQYDPASPAGEHLIAHEVAHTVQQRGSSPTRQNKLQVSAPTDAAEVEADRAADAMVAGTAIRIGPSLSGLGRVINRKTIRDEMDEASEERLEDKQGNYQWGGANAYSIDKNGEMVANEGNDVIANAKRQSPQILKFVMNLSKELDIVKPAVMSWQAADAAVEQLAAAKGIDYTAPEAYAGEFKALHARMAEGATNKDNDLDHVIKHLDAAKNAKVKQSVLKMQAALSKLKGAEAKLNQFKNQLQQARAQEDVKKNEKAKAEIDAAIAQVVTTVTTIATIAATAHAAIGALEAGAGAVNLAASGPGAAVSVAGQATFPSNVQKAVSVGKAVAGPMPGSKMLTTFLENTLWAEDLAKVRAKASEINAHIAKLNAEEVALAPIAIEAELDAAEKEAAAAALEVKDSQETYMTKLIDAGRAWDKRDRSKDKGPKLDPKHEVPMEALLAMEGALTQRGAARDSFANAVKGCPHLEPNNARKIVALALRTKPEPQGPDGVLAYGRVGEGQEGADGAAARLAASSLENAVEFVIGHVEVLDSEGPSLKQQEDRWHATVKSATHRHV